MDVEPGALHLIAGDFNAHHGLWDPHIRGDAMGNEIADWCVDSCMTVANSGAVTYVAPSVLGRRSTPDLTLLSAGLLTPNWRTLPTLGSDHLPIAYDLVFPDPGYWPRQRTLPRQTKLARSISAEAWVAANQAARSYIKRHHIPWAKRSSLAARCLRLLASLSAASERLPRGCRLDPIPWWDPEIDAAISTRDFRELLKDRSAEDNLAWQKAKDDVVNLVREKQRASWRTYVGTMRYTTNPEKTAKLVKQINREPRSSGSVAINSPEGSPLTTDRSIANAFLNTYVTVSCNNHSQKLALAVVSVRTSK